MLTGVIMELRDFLHFNRLSMKKMARDLGISHGYLRIVSAGIRFPSTNLAKKIEEYTGGTVIIKRNSKS